MASLLPAIENMISANHLNHQAVTLLTKSILHQVDFEEFAGSVIPEQDTKGYVHWAFQRVVTPAYTTTDELVYMMQV